MSNLSIPAPTREVLVFPSESRQILDSYLPPEKHRSSDLPFITLTFAMSLDSMISAAPGVQTVLSGLESKAMTHYLRSKHSAILVGVGTAVADNPSLNCRTEGVGGYGGEGLEGQPQPIVVDPTARWDVENPKKILQLACTGRGKAPWIVTTLSLDHIPDARKKALEQAGGKYISLPSLSKADGRLLDWKLMMSRLKAEGIESIMIEGGGNVINTLLQPPNTTMVDSVIVTIAPVWLGQGGVMISPPREANENANSRAPLRLRDLKWHQFGEDAVLCGRIQ